MIALKKKLEATKRRDHCTISFIIRAAKIVVKMLRQRIERKIENVPGEEQFGFIRGKRLTDAIGMLRIMSEQTLEIDEEVCACFID
jgi:hypothetical protein